MRALFHLLVAIAFLAGTFLIDFDHRPFVIKDAIKGFYRNLQPGESEMQRGMLHNPILIYILFVITIIVLIITRIFQLHPLAFYMLGSLTLGVLIHLKMDLII